MNCSHPEERISYKPKIQTNKYSFTVKHHRSEFTIFKLRWNYPSSVSAAAFTSHPALLKASLALSLPGAKPISINFSTFNSFTVASISNAHLFRTVVQRSAEVT